MNDNKILNQYYVPGDGSLWSDAVNYANSTWSVPQPTYVVNTNTSSTWAQSGTGNYVPGILCSNNNATIFANMGTNGNYNDANSYGGGINSRQSVLDLQPANITAENFANNNCTKENWYLFREQTGREYIYAVFKRKSWISDLTCCSDSTVQRNGCNDNYVVFNGDQCSQYMQTYCNSNNITDNICITWCANNNNKNNCENYKNSYCNNANNISNSYAFCRDWCKSSDSNQSCDTGIIEYCNNNLNNLDLCACMQKNNMYAATQKTDTDKVLENLKPICYSKRCAENGYITSAMKSLATTCPRCYQSIEIQKLQAGGKIDLNNFVQSCELINNNINTPSNPTLIPKSTSNQKSQTTSNTQLSKSDLYKQKLRSICPIL
jgi:hypothetical protein